MGGGGIGPQIPAEVAARLGIRVGNSNDTVKEAKDGEERSNAKRKIIGPSMPTFLDKDSTEKSSANDDAESSEDSEVGPSTELAGYSKRQVQQQTLDKLDAQMEQNSSGGGDTANKNNAREEWMLVPPSKRGANGQKTDDGIFDESWTLTPEQRREKATQQAKAAKKQSPEETAASRRKQEEDQDKTQWIEEFNRTQRPKSLMEMHLETKNKNRRSKRSNKNTLPKEQDDTWKRQRFDRDRDLATEQKNSHRQQHAVLNAMGNLTDKYASGKGGSFL